MKWYLHFSEELTEEIKAHMNVHYRDSVQLARFGSAIMPLFNSFVSLEGLSKDLVSASGCKVSAKNCFKILSYWFNNYRSAEILAPYNIYT